MPIEILMPALSPTMTTGNIAKWRVKVGDTVKSGDVMAEIETDKATMELEAVDEGKVAKIIAAEGAEDVAVNSPIAILAAENESLEDANATSAQAAPAVEAAPTSPQKTEQNAGQEAGAEQEQATDSAKASKASKAASKTDSSGNGAAVGADAGFASLTVRDALRDAMAEEMRRDETVFLIGEEVAEYQGAYKVSRGMLQEFGAERVIDTPISEIGFTGISVGSAMAGMKPILEYMTFNFAMQAIDHIINSAVKTRYMSGGLITCPIVFRGPNGAAARVAAQHSQCFASWYAHCPGLIVMAPYDAADAKGMLKAAIRSPNPVVFLENEVLYGMKGPVDPDPEVLVPIGKARVRRTGADVTVVAYSRMVQIAEAAAETLAGEGIDVEIIDLRTIRPLDIETIVESVKKTNRIVSIEEGWPFAGIGSEIAAVVFENAFDWLDAPMVRVCGEDVPMPYAANLESMALPNAEKLVKAIKDVCLGKGNK